jgi:hypothetical protein
MLAGVGVPGKHNLTGGFLFLTAFSSQLSAVSFQQSAINNQLSVLSLQRSAIINHQSAISIPHSPLRNHQSAINNLQSSFLFPLWYDTHISARRGSR